MEVYMNKTTISKFLIVLSLLVSLALTVCSCDLSDLPFVHTCEDADKNHVCDNGCEEILGICEDANKDHACDYGCAKVYGTCEDADKDHACDYGCAEVIGTCEDANKDHDCDYGCAKVYGTCEDADKDHDCDYGCAKVFGEHADGDDNDHLCDYGCNKVADDGCYDTVVDGKCDECGIDFAHACEDTNKDHKCDYGCAKVYGTCEDANKDHKCDYGCTKTFGTCEDANKDHKCDYGCAKVHGTCEDANKDHKCDYGCTKVLGEHADGDDKDHLCDYGCNEIADDGCNDIDMNGQCDECGELNPIFVMFDDNYTAKVTVSAGKTHYFMAYGISSGATLTANGEAVEVVYGIGRMPSTFSITNSTDADVEYTLVINYPLGTYENPESIEDLEWYYGEVSQPEGNSQGYFYTYVAPANGTITFYFAYNDLLENALCDISITNLKTYAQKTLLYDGVDNYGLEVSMDVEAGDKILISVIVIKDADGNYYPAADFTWCGNFSYPIGSQQNPIYPEWTWNEETQLDASTTVTVPAGQTVYFGASAYMIVSVNGEIVETDEDGVISITNDGEADAEYTIVMTTPKGTFENPEDLELGYGYIDLEAGSQGFYYTWTAPATGFFSLEMYSENWFYVINNMTACAYGDWQWSDSDPVVNPAVIFVNEGDVLVIQVNTYDPENPYGAPAGTVEFNTTFGGDSAENPYLVNFQWNDSRSEASAKVTVPAGATLYFGQYRIGGMLLSINGGEATLLESAGPFAPCAFSITNDGEEAVEYTLTISFPVGTMNNPEALFRPSYIAVDIPAGNYEGYYYKWTASSDGTLVLTCPTVEGVEYDVVLTNMSTYAMAWLQDSTDGTVSIAVKAGDEVVIQVVTLPDEAFNYPALEAAITGEFVFPIGHQQNPEILFRPSYIGVNIAAGNNQGYYYKWTSMDSGVLVLTCPAIEGVVYDVILTNMSTYEMAWLQDSTDGTVSIDVNAGDEIVIQVVAAPDDNWEYPAVQTALTGVFNFAVGHSMNPEVIEDLDWYLEVSQAEGDYDGYYYIWTAPANGVITLYFAYQGIPEGYECDIMLTNMNTYAQKSLLYDGVDNYGLELTMEVAEGDSVMIIVAAIKDADGNYYPAADMSWVGSFAYPVGSQKNPVTVEWNWNDDYSAANAVVTIPAGKTLYFNGYSEMVLTINGEIAETGSDGTFSITNEGAEDAEYSLAIAPAVGSYSNPEVIEDVTNFSVSGHVNENASYNYIWTATEDTTIVISITAGANITADRLTYLEGEDWPISQQFELAIPEEDDNWNYIGWIVAENLTIDVVAGQQLKIQVNGLTDWSNWSVPAVDYTLTIVESVA